MLFKCTVNSGRNPLRPCNDASIQESLGIDLTISRRYIETMTMRMGMRRFTRLTNAFSKKVENHAFHLALHYMYYNFVRIHKTLRMTPAMKAGVTDHLWSVEEIARLLK
jgi:hypothetical protein